MINSKPINLTKLVVSSFNPFAKGGPVIQVVVSSYLLDASKQTHDQSSLVVYYSADLMLGRLLSFREGLFFEGRLQEYQFLATWPTHPPPAIRISCFRIPKRPRMKLLQWRSEWFTARFFETKQHLQADHQICLNHATSSGENLTSAHSKLSFFRATSVPWSKQSHVEPRPKAIGGTESMFHDVSTWKGGGEHWEKIPIPSMRQRAVYLHEWLFFYGKCRWIFYRWMLWDQYLKAST